MSIAACNGFNMVTRPYGVMARREQREREREKGKPSAAN